ncbi:unnamed protein product, partial [Staurois parvus]
MPSLTSVSRPRSLKILSLNTKGLNTPEKRSMLLSYLHKQKADVVFLQETHFRQDPIPKLFNFHFPIVHHATNPLAKSKGVAILLARHLPFTMSDSLADPEGRYLFIKGSFANRPVTFANVYAPNTKQVSFTRSITTTLSAFHSGVLILGGDLNVPLYPLLDSSSGSSFLPFKALKQINIQLQHLQLHDSWRTLYPTVKDYTFYSAPHNKYSRIDYLFLSQSDLPLLHAASIEPMVLSDHHPITMTLRFPDTYTRSKCWRLDASLLADSAIEQEIRTNLVEYFSFNCSPDTSPLTQWEAHKCVIRGVLIAAASKSKKDRQERLRRLTDKIHSLERAHKRSLAASTLSELTCTRSQLLTELGKVVKKWFILSQKLYYEFANKSGKFLARALREKRSSMTVHKIRGPDGTMATSNPDIAAHFEHFYRSLYNLPPERPPPHTDESRASLISEFLQLHGPSALSDDLVNSLEADLTLTELQCALKQTKPGKSPGPDGFSAAYYKSFLDILGTPLLLAFNTFSKS